MTKGDYDFSITLTTSGMASYSTAFRYFMAELQEGESSWLWGTVHDKEFMDTYYAMTEAVSDEDYVKNCKKLQQYASDTMFGQALCWETAFSRTAQTNIPAGQTIRPGALLTAGHGLT